MKKNRPAVLVRVIAEPRDRDKLAKILFEQTTTIGLRYYSVGRMILKRTSQYLKTRFGNVTVKIVEEPNGEKRVSPEYEDLKRLAAVNNVPLNVLHNEIIKTFNK
jgi:pyridinium-3,5-bisthiocarboxylic acid mononucleotide nickel chelatase